MKESMLNLFKINEDQSEGDMSEYLSKFRISDLQPNKYH